MNRSARRVSWFCRHPAFARLHGGCGGEARRKHAREQKPIFVLSAMLLAIVAWVADTSPVSASERLNWPCRTGPQLNSLIEEQDAAGIPTTWNETAEQNIRWKLPLEGLGHSTPVIGHNRVWLTAATRDGKQQFVYAIDQESGKVLHHRLLIENDAPEPLGNEVNTYASPSCVLEDDAVYVHFGTYGTARLDPVTADVQWMRKDIHVSHFRGPGSSPIVFDDLLILTFDGINAQFLMALNKHDGSTVWKTDRTTDYGDLNAEGLPTRNGDLRKAYSTPGVVRVGDRYHLVSIGSRAAFAYDVRTGEELWTIRHDDFNASSPPCFFENLAILNTGTRTSNLLAVRLDETTRGDVSQSHVLWDRPKGNSDLSAPVLVEDRIYQIANNGVCVCVNARDGEEVWKYRLEGTFTASPISGGGLIYFCNEEGATTIMRTTDQPEVVSVNQLNEGMRASPSAADGTLFLRTFGHLYAIGETRQ